MKRLVLSVAFAGACFSTSYAAVVVAGVSENTRGSSGSDLIIGFNPAPSSGQGVVVAGPVASGIGGGFGFNNTPFGFNGFNGTPVGFIAMVDSNFVAIFTNQFGTNFVALPFAATDLAPFAGRLPLGSLAPPIPLNAATNAVPGPAPAVPPQTPFVQSPPATLSPVVPQPGGLPPSVPPGFPPTGRLAPPTAPNSPVIPPAGVPTPSPTPVPPNSTPIPPQSTPIPPASTPVPR